jgi:hypothetical protein
MDAENAENGNAENAAVKTKYRLTFYEVDFERPVFSATFSAFSASKA